MKATPTYLLESLSNNDVTFLIPPYQRNYEWSKDTCSVFLADVQKVARKNLDGDYSEHFFGSIVYVIEQSGFGVPDRYVLTDGQQRITTTMLFLMALRDSVDDEQYKETIQRRYIENERADESTEYKIKLKQVETDWEAYKLLALGHEVPPASKNSTVYQNYQFFLKKLGSLDEDSRKNLLEQGLTKFSVISIELEPERNPWENPQEIFESMNSLGKPLSLADLVRNYLLMEQSSTTQTRLTMTTGLRWRDAYLGVFRTLCGTGCRPISTAATRLLERPTTKSCIARSKRLCTTSQLKTCSASSCSFLTL